MTEWTFGTIRDRSDTLDIRYAQWPTAKACDRYVVFLNGRTEWIEKYDYLPADLGLAPGVGFLTMDHRGQGDSGGARAVVESYEVYDEDVRRVIEHVVGDRPYVLVAHSMGGLIALHGTMRGVLNPESLILCSPLLGLPQEPVASPIARPLSGFLSRVGFAQVSTGAGSHGRVPFAGNKLTHDVTRYRRIAESPYPIPGATFGWVSKTFAAMGTVFEEQVLREFKTRTLLLVGSEEQVVDFREIRRWLNRASDFSPAEISYRVIPGARHELLSEIDAHYRPTLAFIRDWAGEYCG